MNTTLPLDRMTIEEKLQLMEELWDDLTHQSTAPEPPSWHGRVLAERQAAVEQGEEPLEDWETAKQRIEQAIK